MEKGGEKGQINLQIWVIFDALLSKSNAKIRLFSGKLRILKIFPLVHHKNMSVYMLGVFIIKLSKILIEFQQKNAF